MGFQSTLLKVVVFALVAAGTTAPAEDAIRGEQWRPLFNGKDLSGWYTFLQEHGKNSDPGGLIVVEDGVIHCYKDKSHGSLQKMGYFATEEEFEDYHLRFQYKWGTTQFQPRLELKRDAGLYYHIVGEDAVWPKSLQCQVQEGDVGDLLVLYGVQADTWLDPKTAQEKEATYLDYRDGGQPVVLGGVGIGYQKKHGMFELEGWNTVEVICRGNTATQIVNGKIVNYCENIRQLDPNKPELAAVPLSKGRIALEIEATEIFYRNIEIRSLKPAPTSAKKQRPEKGLSVGAAAINIAGDNSMDMAGGIGPWRAQGQEGELRATALVIGKKGAPPVALVGCDVLFVTRDMIDEALASIESATGIPPQNILVNASHTHSAPSITRIHGYDVNETFKQALKEGIVQAVVEAHARMKGGHQFEFAQGYEYSVGQNSRLRLADNTTYWTGTMDDVVRPTDPFDPELPVLAFRARNGSLTGLFYNHSTHTIGTVRGMVRSPSFYGLAAQELERELGTTVGFLEGASGSTHNLGPAFGRQAIDRMKYAVLQTLASAERIPVNHLASIKRPFSFKVRTFDEAIEEEKVASYCRKRIPDANAAETTIGIFRTQREELHAHQGEERTTWLQAVRIGDVAIVAVPAEYFTVLGLAIKERSPFDYTYIAELSNDWIGYVPDAKGFENGGYQTWTGHHSYCEPGTGERIVDECVAMLEELRSGAK